MSSSGSLLKMSGRDHVEQRLDGLADHLDVVRVLLVGVGVVLGVTRDLLEVLVVVLGEPAGSRRSPSARRSTTSAAA